MLKEFKAELITWPFPSLFNTHTHTFHMHSCTHPDKRVRCPTHNTLTVECLSKRRSDGEKEKGTYRSLEQMDMLALLIMSPLENGSFL